MTDFLLSLFRDCLPAVHHHGLVLSGPFASYQSHKVQEIGRVIRNAVVRPSQVLELSELSLLLTLEKKKSTT